MLFPHCKFCPFYYSFCSQIPMTYYNLNNKLFSSINLKRITWQNWINNWLLLKTSNNKWIFGKLTSHDPTTGNMKILALIDNKFQYIEQDQSNIIEAWVVDKWTKLLPTDTTLNVSGKWDTNWGEMILNQSGTKVTGTYTHDNGKIEGVLKGNVMTGTWSESLTYSPPKDAGKVELTFTDNSFKGKWGYGDDKLTGSWSGTRIITSPSI